VPYLFRLALVIAAMWVTACVSAGGTTATDDCSVPPATAARIIVKVRDAARLDRTFDDFRRAAREVCATITYVRTLQGNVHLYEITGADADTVERLMQRFGAHANVEYVEPDRIMRHQSPRMKAQ